MNQKNLVIILVLLTILVGGYFFIINSKEIENVDEEKFLRQMDEHKKTSQAAGEKKFSK